MSIRRIVVATDFSAAAELAVESAAELAHSLRASLDLVHVPSSAGASGRPRHTEEDDVDRALAAEAELLFERGILCLTTILRGFSSAGLVTHAACTGADLIVLAGGGSALLGGMAQRVMHRARCPVLIVPPG